MNVLKISLVGPLRSYATKLIKKLIMSKVGYDVDVIIDNIQIEEDQGKMKASLNLNLEMDNDDFYEMLEMLIAK